MKNKALFFLLVLPALFLAGIFSSENDVFAGEGKVLTGRFLDSAVKGITYSSGSLSGVTDSEGSFKYLEGEIVKFTLGDILIGKTAGKKIITPVDLVLNADNENNETVVNIARFLQSLDNDGFAYNKIIITDGIAEKAKGKSVNFSVSANNFQNDAGLKELLTETGKELVSSKQAKTHLGYTLWALKEDIPLPTEEAKKLQDFLDNAVSKYELPGVAVKLRKPDGTVWTGISGMSDLKAGEKITSDTRFRIGSVTKTFTAAAVLQLVQEGKLNLDDSVADLLPDFAENPLKGNYDTKAITIRLLLNHTSRLPRITHGEWIEAYYFNPLKIWKKPEIVNLAAHVNWYLVTSDTINKLRAGGMSDDILKILENFKNNKDQEVNVVGALKKYLGKLYTEDVKSEILASAKVETFPVTTAGLKWGYSNFNYFLLALIIEKITGSKFADEITNRFIKPLGLTNTEIPRIGEFALPGKAAHGYLDLYTVSHGEGGVKGELEDRSQLATSIAWGFGQMNTTVGDLTRWIKAWAEGVLINEKLHNEMLTFIPLGEGLNGKMGLGIFKDLDYGMLGHIGEVLGFSCSAQYYIEARTPIVSCTNRNLKHHGKVDTIVVKPVLSLLFGAGPKKNK